MLDSKVLTVHSSIIYGFNDNVFLDKAKGMCATTAIVEVFHWQPAVGTEVSTVVSTALSCFLCKGPVYISRYVKHEAAFIRHLCTPSSGHFANAKPLPWIQP